MSRGFTHSGSRKSVQFELKRPVAIRVPDPSAEEPVPDAAPSSPCEPPQRFGLPLFALGPSVEAFPTPDLDIALAFDWSVPDLAIDVEPFNPIELDEIEFTAFRHFDDWLNTC
jgi:hypothetical protein